jgi:hypothetical protein
VMRHDVSGVSLHISTYDAAKIQRRPAFSCEFEDVVSDEPTQRFDESRCVNRAFTWHRRRMFAELHEILNCVS